MKCLQPGTTECLKYVFLDSAGNQGPGRPAFVGSWALPEWQAEEKALTAG